uniref:Adrenomedullin n=1 Tax=Anabas testudineus TaxID=64144 RepID=A0A7N6A967_ANATE
MVYSKNYRSFLHLLSGRCSMEIAVLLLLTVPLTAASPLRPTHSRSDADTVHPEETVQTSGVKRSKDTQEEHAPAPKIITFHSEENKHRLLSSSSAHATAVKLRPRRAPKRGCQLGTCQFHNLANVLFNFRKTSGKDESKNANDPRGYGR